MAEILSYTIRPYLQPDEAACIDCFKSNIPFSFTETETGDFRQWLNKLVMPPPDNTIKYFVIALADTIIGCGGISLDDAKDHVVFTWGLLHRNFQKQGYGKALALYRLEVAEVEYPNKDIVLDTTQHTFGFFEKLGFVTESVTPDFYAKGLDRYDMRRSARS